MWNKIANASAIATLFGVGVTSFTDNATKSHIAFGLFAFALAFVTWRLIAALKAWQNRTYPKGYLPIATFIRYRTSDRLNYLYETFRHVQIKTAYKNTFDHGFFWTGTRKPIIKSSLQEVGSLTEGDPAEPKTVSLKFKEHRFYNDTEIVHVEMQLDDSDQASKPFLCAKVDTSHLFRKLTIKDIKQALSLPASREALDAYVANKIEEYEKAKLYNVRKM